MYHYFQVTRVIDEHRAEIIDKGYQFNISTLISEWQLTVSVLPWTQYCHTDEVRTSLKWADGKMLKNEIDKEVCLCGISI